MFDSFSDDNFLQHLAELKKEFLSNLRYEFDEWESILIKIEHKDHFSENQIDLMRKVHSLKGTAGTYNVGIMTTIAHKFEEILTNLSNMRGQNIKNEVDVCLNYVDSLKDVLTIELSDISQSEKDIQFNQLWTRFNKSDTTKKILVASGSRLVVNFIKNSPRFEQSGVFLNIDYFKNGYTALGELLKYPYDIAIVDNQLDQLNGIPLISAIKQSPKGKNLFTILMSSNEIKQESMISTTSPNLFMNKDKESMEKIVDTILNL